MDEPQLTSPLVASKSIGLSRDEMHSVAALRSLAWRDVRTVDHDSLGALDLYDSHAFHWRVFDGDILCGSARLSVHDDLSEAPDGDVYDGLRLQEVTARVAVLSRLVVHPAHRGRRIATYLDSVRLQQADSLGCGAVFGFTSAETRVQMLEGIGMKVVGTGRPSTASPFFARGQMRILAMTLPAH